MNLKDIYISYFVRNGHQYLQSASLIPENDTTLFTSAGVQPLIPYLLLGEKHPLGNRLTSFQKCLRLTDLDNVGDTYHHTFFEMLGNWSLGDYFKNEAIEMSYEFLIKELHLDKERLAVSVFGGIPGVEKDNETAKKWMKLGVSADRIAFLGTKDNWWPTLTEKGPCGPDTEMFYWRDNTEPAPKKFNPDDKRWVEIWNNVFIQYTRNDSMELTELPSKNVDTGMGFERTTTILCGLDDNYESPIFRPLINLIEKYSKKSYDDENNKKNMRIIADHIRSIMMICSDDKNLFPSNKDRGYVLRRLIRRLIISSKKLDISDFDNLIKEMILELESQFSKYYPQVSEEKDRTIKLILDENIKFEKIINQGKKRIYVSIAVLKQSNLDYMDSNIIFRLYETYGVPFDLTYSILEDEKIKYNGLEVEELLNNHKKKSQQSSQQKFGDSIAVKKKIKVNN